jgi:hypothetical protein
LAVWLMVRLVGSWLVGFWLVRSNIAVIEHTCFLLYYVVLLKEYFPTFRMHRDPSN